MRTGRAALRGFHMLSLTAAPGAVACRRCGAASARLRCAPAAALHARSHAGAAAAPAVPHVPVLLPQILGFFEGRAVKVRPPSPDTCCSRRYGRYAWPPESLASDRATRAIAQCYVDATLGAGGHASAMLSAHPVRASARCFTLQQASANPPRLLRLPLRRARRRSCKHLLA